MGIEGLTRYDVCDGVASAVFELIAAMSCLGGTMRVTSIFFTLLENRVQSVGIASYEHGEDIFAYAVQFLSVLILTFWAGTALADKRVALIIGNSQYTRITPKLVNPVNDAHDIAQALESLGFEVILRTDIGKAEFDHSLAEFARKASGTDTALFYYAGHGLQFQGQNYFLPVDIEVQDSTDVEFQAVHQERILEAIRRASGVRIVILDSCRDNPLAKQFATRGLPGGEITRGLARIDRTEGLIIAYATAPNSVAQDGVGTRNSPFAEALIRRIKEPGLEIATMFRRVANDVFDRTHGVQMPELSISLLSDYYLNPAVTDSIEWSRVRESDNEDAFKAFIRKFPASPFAREAQYRVDLFERIRRENDEKAKIGRERIAREAEQKRQEENAKKESERIALEAKQKHQEEEAKKEAELIAQQKSESARLEAEKAEAERLQAEKRAAGERAKVAALEEADRKKHEIELENQHTAELCDRDLAKLKELAATLQTAAIQNLAKETACPTMKPTIESTLREVARGVKRACDADRKTLDSLKDNDIGSLKAALDHMSCDTVRTEAQQRVALRDSPDPGKSDTSGLPPVAGRPNVIDTGTLVIAGRRVELEGVVGVAGPPAKKFTLFIKEQGGEVSCRPATSKKYRCYVGDRNIDLSAAVLLNGSARITIDASEYLRTQENKARERHAGIWVSKSTRGNR